DPAAGAWRRGWFVDGLDRFHICAIEIDADFAGLILDQALAVFHVRVDGRGARAALIAPLAVALVVDLLALDFGFEVGAGLAGKLGRERAADAQGPAHCR